MAKVLDAMPARRAAYGQWAQFLDGRAYEITLGEDVGNTNHGSARTAFYKTCSKHGAKGTYRTLTATTAAIQAVPKESA